MKVRTGAKKEVQMETQPKKSKRTSSTQHGDDQEEREFSEIENTDPSGFSDDEMSWKTVSEEF